MFSAKPITNLNSEPRPLLNIYNQNMESIKEFKGEWKQTIGKLKQKYAILTDNDLLFVEGKQEEFVGRLQVKLGKSKEEVMKIISEL
jgi:uncharacterized protein YjbJ (UPF0337 family)